MRVDLNSDLGESFGPWPMGDDPAMLDLVSSANIACGFHGGDPQVMLRACTLAKARDVSIGAHPGFLDLQGFGRRQIVGLSAEEVETFVAYQIGAIRGVAALAGARVTHVKIHGAMSNMACEDEGMAAAIARAIRGVDPDLIFVVLPFSALQRAGEKAGLRLAMEVFADRAYEDNGLLMSRKKPGSVIHDGAAAAANVLRMVRQQAVTTGSGKVMPTRVDTICIHSDTPGAIAMARQVRQVLVDASVAIRPFASWL
ncbi:MAG TPA: 5-oxoprolinase subunit PxpA [Beijerinckiaceae bacterium]|nr:5-oxoprolinase subunit PxpA [Beijerinckiaceae bacterium]